MTTLSEIVKVEKDVLYRKFGLEPWYCDPQNKENLVFLSPTVLLDDAKLRDGGDKDRGPKEVLGRLTNDILAEDKSKQHRFFQVPEIPYLHMGYGKTSESKRNRMALTEKEGKKWMEFLDLTRHKKPGEVLRKGETPMEVDVTFPTPERPEDHHAFEFEKGEEEELVDPKNSGLKRRVKGSYLLFFSILLIFFKKKNTPSAAKDEEIGANKVSDFLLFWMLPYLLNFTHQKVNAINEHHSECKRLKRQSGEEGDPFQVPTVKKSAIEIIEQAFSSCNVPLKLKHGLAEKFKEYYGATQLNRKYNLPVIMTQAHTPWPVILVPLQYKVTDMPVHIEDIGTKWQKIGADCLFKQFLSKFIDSEEFQTDFFDSFGNLRERFSTDYGIILPDEETFTKLISKAEGKHPDIFREMPQQGRNIAPRLGLMKDTEKNQSVCFSYFSKEHRNKDLFRLIGSHRLSHFTIIVLYGASINSSDPCCELLNLYPVKAYRKSLYNKKQGLRRLGQKTEGKFCSLVFPETFKMWEQELRSDTVVRKIAQSRVSYPTYEHSKPLEVVYTTSKNLSKLKKDVFGAAVAQDLKALEKCLVREANLDGCWLQDIASQGRLKKVALILAINDTLGPDGACWPSLQEAMRRVISSFIQAVIVAGLPSVYPPDPSEDEDKSDEESDSSEEEMDETSVGEQPSTSGVISSGDSGTVTRNSSSETTSRRTVKMGTPDREELERLANKIGVRWKPLGRRLQFEDERLDTIEREFHEVSEQAYRMLLEWKQSNGNSLTGYQILVNALKHDLVGRKDLCEKFYCQ